MTSLDFMNDEDVKKNIKWKKIYGKNTNRVVYEGFTLNNKPCGRGISYYANGKKHLEGKFSFKGFVGGKEYYYNGQIRFEGTCTVCNGYGPNFPIEGKYYDIDGNLLFSGKFEVKKIGSLGWPRIINPENFGHIQSGDTDLEFLRYSDIEKIKEKPKVIAAYDESKYPMNYEQFKEQLLKLFLEKEWVFEKQFTTNEKHEFLECHEFDFHDSYNDDCKKYDDNKASFFEKEKEYENIIRKLYFDCDVYYITKELPEVKKPYDIDESKYPLSFQEFKEKMIGLLISKAENYSISRDQVVKDLVIFFENDPGYLSWSYMDQCKKYDVAKSERKNVEASYIFSDGRLSSGIIYTWGTYLDYWLLN